MKRLLILGLLISASWQSALLPAAIAENEGPAFPNPHKTKSGPAPQNKDFRSEKMKSPPKLQFLPDYTGVKAQFQDALEYPKVKGHAYNIRWQAKEDKDTVLSWYNQVFSQYGWTIPKDALTENSIRAMRPADGITCMVTACKMVKPGYKTLIVVRYVEAPLKWNADKQ
jgi:hypothetical protein